MLQVFVPVARGQGGLAKDSVIDAGHVVTVRQDSLGPPLGIMPSAIMSAVDEALRISLGLPVPFFP